ncbi:hypothetical protein DPMN_051944 [Dreissena polymorpha]|uniref:Uncharacterized protein n=1 Tax=Dreissena polymorpha TaxID=45954 RepID=A0A9D4HQS0_DREPO|nr:hypothetical protein DPMN_051944 [Dreissena polymorpha]
MNHSRAQPLSIPLEFKQKKHRILFILITSGDNAMNPGPPCLQILFLTITSQIHGTVIFHAGHWIRVVDGKTGWRLHKTLTVGGKPSSTGEMPEEECLRLSQGPLDKGC